MSAGLTVAVLAVYPFIAYPLLHKKFRAGRRVEFTAPDGRVWYSEVNATPKFGTGMFGKGVMRVVADEDGALLDVEIKKTKPLKPGHRYYFKPTPLPRTSSAANNADVDLPPRGSLASPAGPARSQLPRHHSGVEAGCL